VARKSLNLDDLFSFFLLDVLQISGDNGKALDNSKLGINILILLESNQMIVQVIRGGYYPEIIRKTIK